MFRWFSYAARLLQRKTDGPKEPSRITHEQLIRCAMAVVGTEACSFQLVPDGLDVEIEFTDYIRPGESTEDEKRYALRAFRTIIKRRISDGRFLPTRILRSETSEGMQYCLVLLQQDAGDSGVAVVTRCLDEDVAKARLEILRSELSAT